MMQRLGVLLTLLLLQELPGAIPVTMMAQATRASIDGIAVHDSTGQPLRAVSVELTVVEGGRVIARTVVTGEDGRFSFTNLAPGQGYQIVVTGTGFWTTAYGQKNSRGPWTPVTLAPGERLTGIQIGVPPVSQLSGRILDATGKPQIGATVVVLRPVYVESRRQFQRAGSTSSNTRGEYRFFNLPAGRYYIRVSPRNDLALEPLFTNPALHDRSGRTRASNVREGEGFRTVYYPGVPLESARPVLLEENRVLDGIDFTVTRQDTSRVRGNIISGATGRKVPDAAVVLVPAGSSPDSNFSRFFEAKDGTFDLRAVLPGKYILNAGTPGTQNALAGRIPVEIRSGESHHFEVRVDPGIEVAGRIAMDNRNTPPPNFSVLTVKLDSRDPEFLDTTIVRMPSAPPSASATVSADGAFALRDVMSWDYRLSLAGLRGVYVKAARHGNSDILADGLQAAATPIRDLEIVLATDGGRLDGRVLDESRKEMENARVVLVPDARSRRDLYIAASTTSTGRFQLSNIPPGRYRVFAWKSAPEGSWLDPDFLALYENRGTPLEVQSEAAEFVELTAIAER